MQQSLEKVSHIIFDWDGTLMDSTAKIVASMQSAATRANLVVPTNNQVEHIIGISLLPAIEQLFDIGKSQAAVVADYYKEIYLELDKRSCALFPDTLAVLNKLKQHFVLGVATGKARRGLKRAFESTNTAHYFSASICADEAESKPSPDMLIRLLNTWGIESQQAVMIGDTSYDLQMAKEINMPRIAVSYGAHSVEKLSQFKPLSIVNSVTELSEILAVKGEATNE